MADVTYLLSKIEQGDRQASEKLLPLVYEELRRLATARMTRERLDHTLQAIALVHEAYVRLVDDDQAGKWNSRGHFLSAAGEAMRRILVELACRKQRIKHGGELARQPLDEAAAIELPAPVDDLIAVDEALAKLEEEDPATAKIVKLRFVGGFSMPEVADVLGRPHRRLMLDSTGEHQDRWLGNSLSLARPWGLPSLRGFDAHKETE